MGSMTRKGQVCSVGNYLLTGRLLGKGHFARVEEATHRLLGKKVAIKIIDLTCIKEEYARRHLHREPRLMAQLRHPCIAALYETMMHGPRLFVVMEAAGGGDLCALVLAARGLPEPRARSLAAQLVSCVRHMHARGVVHRDLKMENIMLDSTKQLIKVVDFGLSNVWSAGGALRTPCGSLEYAALELFEDGRRYGPEVDLWSIGVIVFGMVTGALPFAARGAAGEGSRPQLRAAIARGVTSKQRAALACVSDECKAFIQQLLEPKVELRLKIEEAARHRWVRRPGLRMRTHPLPTLEPEADREIYRELSALSGLPALEVAARVAAEPFGALGGMYNIRSRLRLLRASPADLLWASDARPRAATPPASTSTSRTNTPVASHRGFTPPSVRLSAAKTELTKPTIPKMIVTHKTEPPPQQRHAAPQKASSNATLNSPKPLCRPLSLYGLSKPVFKVCDKGDWLEPRLPNIEEHSTEAAEDAKTRHHKLVRRASLDEPPRLSSCPDRTGDARREVQRATDALPSWRNGVSGATSARVLMQSNVTTIKRASLGNIASLQSSSNSQCKSERAMPEGWHNSRAQTRNVHVQRVRRIAPMN